MEEVGRLKEKGKAEERRKVNKKDEKRRKK